jgi:hypothetical protein
VNKVPNWTVLEMSWADPNRADITRRWLAESVEDKLIRCQPFLGNEVIRGERFVDMILAV